MIRPYIALILAIAIMIFGVKLYSAHKPAAMEYFAKRAVKVLSVGLEDGMFVIRGQNLSSVQVWAVPTGTGITEKDHVKIGDAVRDEEGLMKNTEIQVWRLAVPKEPQLVTALYVKGYKDGKSAGIVEFPVEGATDIYNALWGEVANPDTSKDMVLNVGGKGTLGDVELTFIKVLEDSRCPIDVQCIQAGTIRVAITIKITINKTSIETKNFILSSANPSLLYRGYKVTMATIEPQKKQGMTAQNTKYLIHFLVNKL
jgi:hypothetical protein